MTFDRPLQLSSDSVLFFVLQATLVIFVMFAAAKQASGTKGGSRWSNAKNYPRPGFDDPVLWHLCSYQWGSNSRVLGTKLQKIIGSFGRYPMPCS